MGMADWAGEQLGVERTAVMSVTDKRYIAVKLGGGALDK